MTGILYVGRNLIERIFFRNGQYDLRLFRFSWKQFEKFLPSSPLAQAAFLGWLVCSFHLLVPQLSGHAHAHWGFSHRLDAWVGLGQLSLGWLGLAAKPTWISYNMYLPGFCST